MVEEITSAIREQGAATNNIAGQVERMAQMAEESSAAAGLSANAAKTLDQLAADMQHIIGRYTL
jgi:methyl-accepting chemotaxis protein